MFDLIPEFVLTKPHRLVKFGRAGFTLTGFVITCGLIARVAIVGVPAIRSIGGGTAKPVTLESMYPTLPTWWIPESALGYAFYGVLAIVFIAIAVAGRRLERYLHS